MTDTYKAVGDELRFAHNKAMVVNGLQVTPECVDATITVGAENTNVRAIAIQLKDANGNDVNYKLLHMLNYGNIIPNNMASLGIGNSNFRWWNRQAPLASDSGLLS